MNVKRQSIDCLSSPTGLAEHQVASPQSQLSQLLGHRSLCGLVHAEPAQSGPQRAAVFPNRDHDQVGLTLELGDDTVELQRLNQIITQLFTEI